MKRQPTIFEFQSTPLKQKRLKMTVKEEHNNSLWEVDEEDAPAPSTPVNTKTAGQTNNIQNALNGHQQSLNEDLQAWIKDFNVAPACADAIFNIFRRRGLQAELTKDAKTLAQSPKNIKETEKLNNLMNVYQKMQSDVDAISKVVQTLQESASKPAKTKTPDLPIGCIPQLDQIERDMEDPDFAENMVITLSAIGGRNSGDLVNKMLGKVFDNNFAFDCYCYGAPYERLLYSKIMTAIRQANKLVYPFITPRAFEQKVVRWFSKLEYRYHHEYL